MPALLAMIPVKDWVYGSLIVALLAGFGWYTVHERHEGAAKVEARDVRAVTTANAVVAKDDAAAATQESTDATVYERAVSVPAIGDIGIECVRKRPAVGSVPLSAADSGKTASAGNAAANSTAGPEYDPTGAALTRARQADDQIIYLQGRIAELEKQMNDAP